MLAGWQARCRLTRNTGTPVTSQEREPTGRLPDVRIVSPASVSRASVARGVWVAPGGRAVSGLLRPAVPSVIGPAVPSVVAPAVAPTRGSCARVVDAVRADVRVPDMGRTIGAHLGGRQQGRQGGHDRR